jgi:DNA replication protein DnaC
VLHFSTAISPAALLDRRLHERLTGALLDRLTHRVHILEANGESYRLNDAKKRVKKQNRENPEKPASP